MKNQKVLIIGVIVAIVLGAVALWMSTQSNSNDVQADIGIQSRCAREAVLNREFCNTLPPCNPNDVQCLSKASCINTVNEKLRVCLEEVGNTGGCSIDNCSPFGTACLEVPGGYPQGCTPSGKCCDLR